MGSYGFLLMVGPDHGGPAAGGVCGQRITEGQGGRNGVEMEKHSIGGLTDLPISARGGSAARPARTLAGGTLKLELGENWMV
jgi:hypothetical protein